MSDSGYLYILILSMRLLFFLFFSLFVIFLIYVFWPYPQMRGVDTFGNSVRLEYIQVSAMASDTLKRRIRQIDQATYSLFFVRTGWDAWLNKKQHGQTGNAALFLNQFPLAVNHARRLFSLRLALLWEHLAWLGFILIPAAVDGWVGWARRRHTGSMESAFICRHTGLAALIIFCALFFVYPLIPWQINHRIVLTIAPVFFSLMVRFFICYFRKYI